MANNRQFARQLDSYRNVVEKAANKEVRKIALAGLSGVITKSPVDEGTFKANWNVGINSVDDSVNENFKDKLGGATISKGSGVIRQFKNGDSINISNNMPYANRLEFGYSAQSSGMVRRTFAQLKSLIRNKRGKV